MKIILSPLVVACLIASSMFPFQAGAATFLTNTTWLATDSTPGAGWNTDLNFDTSEWVNAFVIGPGNLGDTLWYPGLEYSWGQQVWFRQIIDIPASFGETTLTAAEDDDAQVFINGHMVINDANHIATANPTLSIANYLNPGQNLIAVVAMDTYCCNHGFDARIEVSTVPTPGSYAMMTIGLGLLSAIAYRRKTKPYQRAGCIVA